MKKSGAHFLFSAQYSSLCFLSSILCFFSKFFVWTHWINQSPQAVCCCYWHKVTESVISDLFTTNWQKSGQPPVRAGRRHAKNTTTKIYIKSGFSQSRADARAVVLRLPQMTNRSSITKSWFCRHGRCLRKHSETIHLPGCKWLIFLAIRSVRFCGESPWVTCVETSKNSIDKVSFSGGTAAAPIVSCIDDFLTNQLDSGHFFNGLKQGPPIFLKLRATSCVPINAKGYLVGTHFWSKNFAQFTLSYFSIDIL